MSRNVLLDYVDNYDISSIQHSLEKAFFSLDIGNLFKSKKKVLVKVCLPYSVPPDNAETTHPSVVRAVVNILSNYGVQCIVADSPYKKYSHMTLDQVYVDTGMLEMANLTKCELNRNLKTFEVNCLYGVKNKSLTLLDIINDVDMIVNVGKIKIDENLGYFGACANMFGLVPGDKKSSELNRLSTLEDFNNYAIDIVETLKDKLVLNILDGVVARESGNSQRMLYCLGVSENPYSLDAAILDILGVEPKDSIVQIAANRNLLQLEKPYKLIGEKIEHFKIEDFALNNITNNTNLHKNESERKREYKRIQERTKIDNKKCKGCSICSKICPAKAITMRYDKNGELYAEIDYKKCIMCFKCLAACPYSVVQKVQPIGFKNLDKEIKKYNE